MDIKPYFKEIAINWTSPSHVVAYCLFAVFVVAFICQILTPADREDSFFRVVMRLIVMPLGFFALLLLTSDTRLYTAKQNELLVSDVKTKTGVELSDTCIDNLRLNYAHNIDIWTTASVNYTKSDLDSPIRIKYHVKDDILYIYISDADKSSYVDAFTGKKVNDEQKNSTQ